MDAIIVTGATSKEIAAFALAVQGRQEVDGSKGTEPVKLAPGMLVILDGR